MSDDGLVYQLYRRAKTDMTGSRDWGIAITAEGDLAIRAGETGRTVQRTDVPPIRFEAGSVQEELDRRCHVTMGASYAWVGKACVRKGHFEVLASDASGAPQSEGAAPAVAPSPAPPSLVCWEIKVTTAR